MTRFRFLKSTKSSFINKVGIVFLIVLPPILIILIAITLGTHARDKNLHLEKGFLDMTDWSQSPDIVRLSGEFEFLGPQGLTYRQVPDQWKNGEAGAPDGFGYGVYRFRLRLPTTRRWGLKIATVSTSWRLKIFGKEVAHAGNPHPDPTKAVPAYLPSIVLLPESELIDFEIEVSNWDTSIGGLRRPVEIGPYRLLRQNQNTNNHVYVGLALTLVSLALLCLIGFGYFPEFRSLLFFSILCLVFGLRTMVSGDYLLTVFFPELSFNTLIRLEYLSIYFPIPVIVFFITEIFQDLPGRKLIRLTSGLYVPLLIALPFLPLIILTRTILPVGLMNISFALVMIILPLTLVPSSRSISVLTISSGGLTLFLSLLNDYLHNNVIIQTTNLLPWGQYVYCLMLGSVILRETALFHRENKTLSEDLKKANQRLLKEIEFNESSKQEIYHQVRNNLQIINSIISLDYEKLSDPRTNPKALKSLQLRISALGLVQEKILESILTEEINLIPYFSEILNLIRRNLFTNEVQVEMLSSKSQILLNKSQCRDLSMIMIEFIIYLFENLSEIQSIKILIVNKDENSIECFFYLGGKLNYGKEGTCEGVNIMIIESYCIKNNFRYELNCGDELTTLKVSVPVH